MILESDLVIMVINLGPNWKCDTYNTSICTKVGTPNVFMHCLRMVVTNMTGTNDGLVEYIRIIL